MKRWIAAFAAAAVTFSLAVAAPAPEEVQTVFAEARAAAQAGPVDLPLAGQATLKLPAGTVFIPQPQATKLLNVMGNPGTDERMQGLVFPSSSGNGSWFVIVRHVDAGHVSDDDARGWNADELLKSIREGTEAANEARAKMGVPALDVQGWAEKPAYDAATHRLVWAMSSREQGAPAEQPQGVNYNTYVLGREGYFSLNLVTSLKDLPAHKPEATRLLAALDFDDGKRYADFDARTDKVAAYGLAALVVGLGAKKLGLLALAGVFVAKFAKVILLGLAVFGGGAAAFFKRRRKASVP